MGSISFGYKRVGKDDMALDEQEAPIRKMMFDLFLEHKRFGTVANILNDKGYRTKRKSLFSGTTIKRLLQDPKAKGIRRSHTTKIDENGKTVMRDKEEWYIHEAPRIVSDEVNAIIQE